MCSSVAHKHRCIQSRSHICCPPPPYLPLISPPPPPPQGAPSPAPKFMAWKKMFPPVINVVIVERSGVGPRTSSPPLGGGGALALAPLTRKRHIPPHPAQAQHTNHRAPRTQRPSERSDPTQHAKGRTGHCPGPRKETTTRRNVTRGGGGGALVTVPAGGGERYDATRAPLEKSKAGCPVGAFCFVLLTEPEPQPPQPPACHRHKTTNTRNNATLRRTPVAGGLEGRGSKIETAGHE